MELIQHSVLQLAAPPLRPCAFDAHVLFSQTQANPQLIQNKSVATSVATLRRPAPSRPCNFFQTQANPQLTQNNGERVCLGSVAHLGSAISLPAHLFFRRSKPITYTKQRVVVAATPTLHWLPRLAGPVPNSGSPPPAPSSRTALLVLRAFFANSLPSKCLRAIKCSRRMPIYSFRWCWFLNPSTRWGSCPSVLGVGGWDRQCFQPIVAR
jgi:hypothetical protein